MTDQYFDILMENYKNPEKGRLGISVDVWANIINHSGQSDADIMAILYERDVEHEEIREIQYRFNIQAEAFINLMEENKRLRTDVYNLISNMTCSDEQECLPVNFTDVLNELLRIVGTQSTLNDTLLNAGYNPDEIGNKFAKVARDASNGGNNG